MHQRGRTGGNVDGTGRQHDVQRHDAAPALHPVRRNDARRTAPDRRRPRPHLSAGRQCHLGRRRVHAGAGSRQRRGVQRRRQDASEGPQVQRSARQDDERNIGRNPHPQVLRVGASVRQGGGEDSRQRAQGVDAIGVRVGRRFLPHLAERSHHPAHIGVSDLHQGAGRAAQRGDGLHDRRIVQHHALPVRVHAHGDAPVHPEPHFAAEVGPVSGAAGIGEVRRSGGASFVRCGRWRWQQCIISAGGGQHHHPERIVRLDGIR